MVAKAVANGKLSFFATVFSHILYLNGKQTDVFLFTFPIFGVFAFFTCTSPSGFVSIYGQSECLECTAGKFGNIPDNTECQDCSIGYYSESVGAYTAATCIECPVGTYSTVTGVDSLPKCQACSPGQASNVAAAQTCTSCKESTVAQSGASECKECPNGFTNNDELTTCNPCDSGRYGDASGCHDCPAGEYQDGKGETTCKQCAVDTYLTESGKTSNADCLKCNADRSTGEFTGNVNDTFCLCKRGAYYQNDKSECIACPPGGDCSAHDGLTLNKVIALPGYWRANATTNVFTDCKDAFSASLNASADAKARCIGGSDGTGNHSSFDPDDQCEYGFGGPSCMSCIDGHVMLGVKCTECTPSIGNVVGAIAGLMLFLFFIFAILFLKAKKDKDEDEENNKEGQMTRPKKGCCGGKKKQRTRKKNKNQEEKLESTRDKSAASRLVGDQVLTERMRTEDSSGNNDTYRDDSQVVIDRIKIFYGWMQIFTALTFTFDIPWPIQLKSFSLGLGFINFDIGFVSNLSCDMAIPFLQKMTVHAALPLLLLLTIVTARLPAYFLGKKSDRKTQKALMIKFIFSLALILYPGLCTRFFTSLKEVTVEGLASATHSGQVLAVDYSVEAYGKQHQPYVFLCIVCMVVYVLGIPLAVFFALRANHKYLYSEGKTEEHRQRHHDVVDEFGTLYLQYEAKYWYWEVTVIFKKMLLTGAMTVVAAGSSAQLVIALLIVLVNLLLILKLGPFVDTADDYLSFLTSCQMFLTLLGGLLIMTDDSTKPTYDPNFMGITMVVVNGVGFVALIFSLLALHPKCRKRLNGKNMTTKVVPAKSMNNEIRHWKAGEDEK